MKKKKYIKVAKEVIDLEIKALVKLKKSISNSFNLAVQQILKCQSKVILCGVGKSGLIANKIASTFSSVGTPSFYLSASDSSHGDLGSISKKDILILISNSGETNELKNIIQFANRNKILLIGIVSQKSSVLYKSADIKLLIPKAIEAGSIIPTSSTTSQLALGDALAIATMKHRKFNKKDFKKIHPAGSLGAQLKTVEDIMLKDKAIPFVNENLKSFERANNLAEKLIQNKFNRNDVLISVGGGVIGDFSGFVASIVKRGIYHVNLPTTLLAQVDASIGGKTGVNSKYGKNLIGSFYSPQLVIIELKFLESLNKL